MLDDPEGKKIIENEIEYWIKSNRVKNLDEHLMTSNYHETMKFMDYIVDKATMILKSRNTRLREELLRTDNCIDESWNRIIDPQHQNEEIEYRSQLIEKRKTITHQKFAQMTKQQKHN